MECIYCKAGEASLLSSQKGLKCHHRVNQDYDRGRRKFHAHSLPDELRERDASSHLETLINKDLLELLENRRTGNGN